MDQFNIFLPILVGLLFGSFLNVCIYRLPRRLSVVSPMRSYCPNCNRTLGSLENIPVLSWLLLRGKCKGCGQKISAQYPLVEILAAIATAGVYLRYGLNPTSVVLWVLVLALIVVTFIDLEFKIIPHRITYPGMTIGFLLGIASQYTELFRCSPYQEICPITQNATDSLIGFLLGAGFFEVMARAYYFFTKRDGLGGGDVRLLGMTGAVMGWHSVPPTIFVGSFLGAFIGILAMVFTGRGRHTEIPFGPWLAAGALLYLFADLPFFRV